MLTPLSVMLGIWPPGENWPFTLVGFRASLSSPGPRSEWPRGSMSGRTTPELSQRTFHSPFHSALSLAQVPTPFPGLPPGLVLYPDLLPLHWPQHWPDETHMEAWFSASSSAESDS